MELTIKRKMTNIIELGYKVYKYKHENHIIIANNVSKDTKLSEIFTELDSSVDGFIKKDLLEGKRYFQLPSELAYTIREYPNEVLDDINIFLEDKISIEDFIEQINQTLLFPNEKIKKYRLWQVKYGNNSDDFEWEEE